MATQIRRHPAVNKTASQQNESATLNGQKVLPELDREPEARILPDPGPVLITVLQKVTERLFVNSSAEGNDSRNVFRREFAGVVSSVGGLPEKVKI